MGPNGPAVPPFSLLCHHRIQNFLPERAERRLQQQRCDAFSNHVQVSCKTTKYTNILFPPESSTAVLQGTDGVGFDWTNKKVHLNKLVPDSKCCNRARASWNATATEIETIPLSFFPLMHFFCDMSCLESIIWYILLRAGFVQFICHDLNISCRGIGREIGRGIFK